MTIIQIKPIKVFYVDVLFFVVVGGFKVLYRITDAVRDVMTWKVPALTDKQVGLLKRWLIQQV